MKIQSLIILGLSLILFSCEQEAKTFVVQGEAQGTTYTIKYISKQEIKDLKVQMDSLLDAFDQSLSTYKDNSLISKLNRGESIKLDAPFKAVYLRSMELNQQSDGAFDPTIAPLISSWGFNFENPQVLDSAQVDSLLQYCGFQHFEIRGDSLMPLKLGVQLNFNAIAQGYAVDLMGEILKRHKQSNFYVELGGELVVRGKNPEREEWKIGIDKPIDDNLDRELSHLVRLSNKAMATSGNYRSYYEFEGKKYPHTLNPKTGFPVQHHLLSATIIAEDCMTADAVATACMVMGFEKSKSWIEQLEGVEALLIYSEKDQLNSYHSSGLQGKVEPIN